MTNTSKTPEQIEDEIRETQTRIGQRVEQLQSGMRPANLIDQFLPGNNGDLRGTAQQVANAVRGNPLPAALVGAGLVWLLSGDQNRRNTSGYNDDHNVRPNEYDREDPADKVGQHLGNLRDKTEEHVEKIKQSASNLGEHASEASENIRNRASDIASSASETASDLANRADRAVRAAPSRIRSAGGRGGRWVKDNPIPAGLMCVAAGATIASVLAVRNTTDGNETDNQPDHQRTAPERRDENNADTPINTPQPVKSPISATTMPSKTASGSVVENGATSAKDQNAAETGKADSTADALKSPRPKLSTARV